MKPKEIYEQHPAQMELADLYHLLKIKTLELLSMIEQKSKDGIKMRDLKLEIEELQDIIKKRMARR